MSGEATVPELVATIERLRKRIAALREDIAQLREKYRAIKPGLPGRKFRNPEVEKWRSLVVYAMNHYAQKRFGRNAHPYEIDFVMGIIYHESNGNHIVRSKKEWIGQPPPGYDPGNETTRATGLVQHVPAFFDARARAAGFEGWPILDPYAQLMTVAWMIYDNWRPEKAPNFNHWPDAPDGTPGSTTVVKQELAPLYPERT